MDILNIIIGQVPASSFIAAMLFAFIGFSIQKGLSYRKSIKNPNTPKTFSISFWLKDNWDDIVFQFFLLFTVVRFGPDILAYFSPESVSFFQRADGMAIYLVLGFFLTRLTKVVKKSINKK